MGHHGDGDSDGGGDHDDLAEGAAAAAAISGQGKGRRGLADRVGLAVGLEGLGAVEGRVGAGGAGSAAGRR